MLDQTNLLTALGLTLLAGLSTGVGSAMAFFSKRTNTSFLAASLGFSAGVMIFVSLVEIFSKARTALAGELGEQAGYWVTTAAFFGGIALIASIDKLIPSMENPHEARSIEDIHQGTPHPPEQLMRIGVFTAVAVAIHNIPEGVAISVPVYFATGSRGRAFRLSFLSGFSEPVGAVIGYLLLLPFMNDLVFGILFAAVAGIMVFISLDELLPTAEKYGEHHLCIYGLISGMVVMAISLLLMA